VQPRNDDPTSIDHGGHLRRILVEVAQLASIVVSIALLVKRGITVETGAAAHSSSSCAR
jgi:hypothetical protein